MRNFQTIAIVLFSGACLSDPINMETVNSIHLDAEPLRTKNYTFLKLPTKISNH